MTKAERLQKIVTEITRALLPWVNNGRTGKVCFEINISQGSVSAPVVETKEILK